MQFRELGKTGIKVSEIGFGAWAIGGEMWGKQDDADSIAALHKALDLGYTFLDTAALYGFGANEALIGGTLKARRGEYVLASKCGMTGGNGVRVIGVDERCWRHTHRSWHRPAPGAASSRDWATASGYSFSIVHCSGCWCCWARSITWVTLVSATS